MLRYLTSLPPGKVRFTIIDPMGLGENFAGFMHLADYDEALVNSRIWTEPAHIEQRLADLTAHMENVIQKYLRNQFETIEEYNAQAGEVAEPYRIGDRQFPGQLQRGRRAALVSILSSGPRCGVYALMSVDTKQELPQGLPCSHRENALNLDWKDDRFVWHDDDFEKFPLNWSPLRRRFHARSCTWSAKGSAANRVEVPFEFIAAPPEKMWKSDSRAGVDVALGASAPPSGSICSWARARRSTC